MRFAAQTSSRAQPLTLDLLPGQILYMPSGWWHAVEVLETSVSVAARSYRVCEMSSYLPNFLFRYLAEAGVIAFEGRSWCIAPQYVKYAQQAIDDFDAGGAVESSKVRG